MNAKDAKKIDCTRKARLELANILEGVYNFRVWQDEQKQETKEKATEASGETA